MRPKGIIRRLLLAFVFLLAPSFLLDLGEAGADNQTYVPDLGDLMEIIQLRHSKIWYAGPIKKLGALRL